MSLLNRMGVRGRLLLAFLAISGFAVAAAGAAMYAFERAGEVLHQITQERLPPALASLELSRQAERIVAAAPALLSVSTQAERDATFDRVATELARLVELLEQIEAGSDDISQLISVRVSPLVFGFDGNLDDLNFIIEDRLRMAERRRELLNRFTSTLRASQRLVAPGALLIDSTLDSWINNACHSATGAPSGAAARQLIETLMPLLPQRKAEVVISAINDSFLQIAMAEDAVDVPVHAVPIERSIDSLENVAAAFPRAIRADMERQIAEFEELFAGEDGLIEIRRRELESVRSAEQVLADNALLAQHLTAAVNQLIAMSKEDIRLASADALRVQKISSAILIAVVVMSLVSSGLIAWLYVDRNLVARLKALSDSMLAIAGGNLRAPLPSVRSRDEIGRMGEALAGFRDTAVEIEENNLRDIARARARLIDALESTSEGFAFFDADDRLELSNARYRELLHGGEEIPPGTPFKAILKRSVARGAVGSAEIDPESWIEERLARHRNPGEPLVQQRNDGRWIMISERRTEGGGGVAVYSDITELKQREAALAAERERLAQVTERLDLALSMDGIGIWDVNLDSGDVWWSPQYTVMMGHDLNDYRPSATAWEEHLHPDEAAEIISVVDRFLEGREETLRITQHMLTGDGRDLWTEALMHVQRDQAGRAVRLTGIDVDVTEQRLKEAQVEAANVEIARKNQELEALSTKLAKYLSPQVYASIFSGQQEVKIASVRKKLTVFFSDIVGFTETTDKVESEELTQLSITT